MNSQRVQSMVRRIIRFMWMLVYFSSRYGMHALLYATKHMAFLRREIRRGLLRPLQRIYATSQAKFRNLPPAIYPLTSCIDVETETSDGVILHGTLYVPFPANDNDPDARPSLNELNGEHKFSTIMVRTPYGRHSLGPEWARIFAERGFAVIIQDTRGRFGSGGDFFPVKHEVKDGGETIEWIRKQPWSNGKVSLFGVSYLGLTTYAAAGSSSGHHVSAMVPVMTGARAFGIIFHRNSGTLALDLVLRWLWLAMKLMNTPNIIKFWFPALQQELKQSFTDAPLHTQDEKLIGQRLGFLQDAIRATDVEHEFWADKDVLCNMKNQSRPPAHIIGGWYDFFLKQSFEDFEWASQHGDKTCRMTVGTWKHWHFMNYSTVALSIALDWFQRYMENHDSSQGTDEHAIHVAIIGTSPTRWCSFDSWPPKVASTTSWPLKRMITATNTIGSSNNGSFSFHQYDPNDPTPYCGGPSFDPFNSGRKDQSSLEARSDVLVFSSMALTDSMYICGDVYVELHAQSNNPHTDFFLKLCQVAAPSPWSGTTQSFNLTEDLARFGPDDWDGQQTDENGTTWYELKGRRIKVGPIAARYGQGTRVRLQISGGAHPLYMRNFGTGHDIAEAVETCPADHRVFHDTKLLLPLIDARDVELYTDLNPAFPDHVPEYTD
eukprot:CAMPEP_0171538552 /NCGR_PEP_ID=MMETSP0960-20121227/102_1 /TAXON_ID=87120 /ORGANISM="Aurantiochytrium limacinum, Strain ATCCMYA-1381" /LENGTH=660 /DNA_ID=CAMNT_0012085449 /DNA_START=136 /DNA_END=2118 /DNA_ORIENTATION=+